MSTIIKILMIVPAIYLVLLLLLFIFQRSLMYFPAPLDDFQRQHHLPFEEISIMSEDGLEIKSWIAKKEPDKKTIVFFHGNAGNAAHRIPMLKEFFRAGHTVVLAEYRGYGDNPGKPSENGIISDAERLMEYVIAQGTAVEDIVLMGRSLGTGPSTNLATKYDVAALILVSPFSSFPDVAASTYPYFPVRFLMKDKFDSKSIIKNIKAPVLMFHGEFDRIIPLHFGEALFEAANEPKQFERILMRGHNNLDMEAINNKILEFILDK